MAATSPSRQGSALIIVLGFLAVLTILVFIFAAQMRSGRLAGRAYLNHAQTGHLLNTALTRAMDDIELITADQYPLFLATNSFGDGSLLLENIDFDVEEDYFPAGNDAIWQEYVKTLENARWQTIKSAGIPIGRVGYIIINTSGLLDANWVAGYTNTPDLSPIQRASGHTPAELQLSEELLPELGEAPKLVNRNGSISPAETPSTAFAWNRDHAWKRYESLRDVALLNAHAGDVLIPPLTAFCTYTLFPAVDHEERFNLGPSVEQAAFIDMLKQCGLQTGEAESVYENYLDYIDADSIPRNLEGSSPEAAAMLNEIVLSDFSFEHSTYDGTNVEFNISGTLSLESWYPFAATHPNNTTVECRPANPDTAAAGGGTEIVEGESYLNTIGYITITALYTNESAKSFVLPLRPEASGTVTEDNFKTTRFTFYFENAVRLEQPFENGDPPAPRSILAQLGSIEIITSAPVDRVERILLNLSGASGEARSSCIDPRINHDFSNPDLWETGAAETLNSPNQIPDWGEEEELADKSNIRFFVRNGPMQSVGELGLLSTGEPWRTVRLRNQDDDLPLHPVLDRFSTASSDTEKATHPGLVNMNTAHPAVAATVFFDTPTYPATPEFPDGLRVTAAQALTIGENLSELNHDTFVTNLSMLGNAFSNNIPGWVGWCDARKDAVLANSASLFGWRDTQYVLLLVAEAGSDIDENGVISDDEVRATRKAVAQVWRDPVTGAASCVFYGRTETLRTSLGGGATWGSILKAFKP